MPRTEDAPPFRPWLREVMEPYEGRPDSTRLSLLVDVFILFCILASSVLVGLEHAFPEDIYVELGQVFYGLDILFTLIFVVEYGLRWYTARRPLLYPFTPYAIIDLLAILPSVLLLAADVMLGADLIMLRWARGVRLLRFMRLLRLVRLFKLLRHGFVLYRGVVELRIWYSAVQHRYRLKELGRLVLGALLALIVGANLLHVTEAALLGPAELAESPFGGYWESYWHIVIVLISGIEDKEPITLVGRLEVTMLMIAGVVVIGMLTGEICSILVQNAQRRGMVPAKPPRARLEQHIVILGCNSHIDRIIRLVHAALEGHHYILVVGPTADRLPTHPVQAYRRLFALRGDPADAEVLAEAAVEEALRVVVLAERADADERPRDVDNRSLMQALAVHCRSLQRQRRRTPITLEVLDPEALRYATQIPEIEPVLSQHIGERMVTQALLNHGITEIYDQLQTFDDTSELYTAPVPPELIGRSYREAQLHFLDADDEVMTLLGIDRSEDHVPSSRFWLSPEAPESGLSQGELVLGAGDRLILMAFHPPSFLQASKEAVWSGQLLSRS